MSEPTISIDALRNAVARLPHDSLTTVRLEALEHFNKHGLPTTRHEDWKYTNLKSIVDISNSWLASGADVCASAAQSETSHAICESIDAHWLVIANGIVDQTSLAAALNEGINVTLLSQGTVSFNHDAPMSDLGTALLRDGLRIHIGANQSLEKPVGLLIIDNAGSETCVTQSRVEIDLAEDSDTKFIEYHASSGHAAHYSNSIIDLKLGDRAKVKMVRVQQRSLNHTQTTRLAAALSHDSQFEYCGFDLGGRLVRNDLHIDIVGRGASATFNGLYLGEESQHIDNHTRVDHKVGPAVSVQEYRGILTGNCQCIWNGKAIVHAGADGTDAQQANHNLLLSEQCEIDAKPELEIYADDVKCAHGTTVGQLDEKALFYLRSRGLSLQTAKQVLMRAFAGSIVNKAPIQEIRQNIAEMVESRLSEIMGGFGE